MTGFQHKTLDPVVRNASLLIDAALDAESIASKRRRLLTARDDNKTVFARIARRQIYKIVGSALLACSGALAAAGGIMTATSIFSILAGTTGMAIPLAVAGGVAFLAGVAFLVVASANYGRVKKAWKSLNAKTDQAVSRLSEA